MICMHDASITTPVTLGKERSARLLVVLEKEGDYRDRFAFARYDSGLKDWIIENHGGNWKVVEWGYLPQR